MRQTLYDGYLVIFALAQAVILLMLTPLFTGISRQIRARMHSRRGPGIGRIIAISTNCLNARKLRLYLQV